MKRRNEADVLNAMHEKTGGKKLAVLFPGIGYTCDKPLLYYAGKLAEELGFEVIRLGYKGFPKKVRGDREKMEKSFFLALDQTREQLTEIPWEKYERIVFISKSIGTIVACACAREMKVPAEQILMTPLADTFRFLPESGESGSGHAIAFHGTADPWAVTEEITEACRVREIPLYLTEKANHSLETGDVERDLKTLTETMRRVRDLLTEHV